MRELIEIYTPRYQTITVKYLEPTNYRGGRYKAISTSGISITIPKLHEHNSEQGAALAALQLAKKLNWSGTLVGGCNADTYVFVFVPFHRYETREPEISEWYEIGEPIRFS
jgi:hypothetical protein